MCYLTRRVKQVRPGVCLIVSAGWHTLLRVMKLTVSEVPRRLCMNDHQQSDCRPTVVLCVSPSRPCTILTASTQPCTTKSVVYRTTAKPRPLLPTTGTDCDPSSHQCAGINNHRRTQALLTTQHTHLLTQQLADSTCRCTPPSPDSTSPHSDDTTQRA